MNLHFPMLPGDIIFQIKPVILYNWNSRKYGSMLILPVVFLQKITCLFRVCQKRTMILLMDNILHLLRLVVHPIIYRILNIPGGAGFLPSTVVSYFFGGSWIARNDQQNESMNP